MPTLKQIFSNTQRYDEQIALWGGSAISLALRFYVGKQFFMAGLTKTADWGTTLALFENEYHVPLLSPALAAAMAAGGELLLPMLLFFGLLSRPAAVALFVVNLIAVISYPQLFAFDCPAAINDHFYWGMLLLVLAAFGPGRVSLDAYFRGAPAKPQ